jgi:NAD(P)-dependent dehydrogenase (short-subunit alcohol dehydrogenase family)
MNEVMAQPPITPDRSDQSARSDEMSRVKYDLSGTAAVITGAAQGIGLAVAIEFARAGAALLLVDRDAEVLEQAHRLVTGMGSVAAQVADVTDDEAMHRCAEFANTELGPLEAWVNNAGIVVRNDPDRLTSDERQSTMAVNVDGTWNGSIAAHAVMAKSGRGSIVNLSSISAFRVSAGRAAYGPSKAAISAMTRNLAFEWGPDGVRVNAVAPGFVDTRMTAWLTADPDLLEGVSATIPLRRIASTADIARVIVALSTEAFAYVTGQTVIIDGGWSL